MTKNSVRPKNCESLENSEGLENSRDLELYIHVPFCVKKCLYCDFLSGPESAETMEAYVEALCLEIREAGGEGSFLRRQVRGRSVSSIFIGGGTPSLLSGRQIRTLMETVRECFVLKKDAEITMEANPGTVDAEKLSAFRSAGINRLSIGLQSANDEELKRLGRIHCFSDFVSTYENARRAGFSNINVDVMSALPGQTYDSYRATLKKVLSLVPPPEHISAYSLIVEEETPFYRLFEQGKLELPDEDTERLMYEETETLLQKKGYARYEISNYAREGFACRHNCGYWERADYLGFGIGAASLLENVRFQNGRDLQAYLQNPSGCRQEEHILSKEEQMEEFMFLGLRMMKGVSPAEFYSQFGVSMEEIYGPVIAKNIADGLLCWLDGEESGAVSGDASPDGASVKRLANTGKRLTNARKRLALTKKGIDVSNYCMAQFLL